MAKTKAPSPLFVIPAVVFTAFSSIIIRLISASPIVIAFYRMVFSSFLVLPFTLLKNKGCLPTPTKRTLLLCLLSGAFLAIHFASWIASLAKTSIAASTILVSLCPLFVIVYQGIVYKQKPTLKTSFALSVALAGTILIALDSYTGGSGLWGNFLALIGGIAVAGYLILGEEAQKELNIWSYVFYVYSFSAVFLGFFALSQGLSSFIVGGKNIFLILLMSILCSLLGHTVYNWLVGYHGAGLISLAILAEPVFASLLALPILKESPGFLTLLGGLFILPAVALTIKKDK